MLGFTKYFLIFIFFISFAAAQENAPQIQPVNAKASQELLDVLADKTLEYSIQEKKINELIIAGADPSFLDKNGTPLLISLANTFMHYAHYLMKLYPESANVADKDGRTVLMYIAESDRSELMDAFLNSGASVNSKDKFGNGPLYYLLKSVYDLRIRRGESRELPTPSSSPNRTDVVLTLLGKQLSHRLKNPISIDADQITSVDAQTGKTPLMLAATSLNSTVLQAMLDKVPLGDRVHYINQRDNQGSTALFYAINYKNDYAFSWLIENGADINIKSAYNYSPLKIAIYSGNLGVVSTLLLLGVDKKSAFIDENEEDPAKAKDHTFRMVASMMDSENIKLLPFFLDMDIDWTITETDPFKETRETGITFLHVAARTTLITAIQAFLKKGLSPDAADYTGSTPIMIVENGDGPFHEYSFLCFEALLKVTTNLNQVDKSGKTLKKLIEENATYSSEAEKKLKLELLEQRLKELEQK